MRYELYAVEVRVSLNPETYDLVRRENEDGAGSPLTWKTRRQAEDYIDRIRGETGAEVVVLTGGTDRKDEPGGSFEDLLDRWIEGR